MSSGGSAGDAGSTSQEATMEEDYNTGSTDLVDSSVSIEEVLHKKLPNFDDYDVIHHKTMIMNNKL